METFKFKHLLRMQKGIEGAAVLLAWCGLGGEGRGGSSALLLIKRRPVLIIGRSL